MSLSIVILAAGKGTRMNSALPKVLQPLGDRPMLQHVIDTASKLNPSRICVVIGHGAESVRDRISTPVEWVMQTEQKGTGHAVQQALPNIPEEDEVLVLYGDVPLTRLETLTALTQCGDGLGLLTVDLDDPRGYGRIVREKGEVIAIVEEKDASDEQRAINETNTGILSGRCRVLNELLSMTDSNNAQGEYYLTDVFALAHSKGIAINTAQASDEWEVSGVNNKDQLTTLERQYQSLQVQALLDAGVTVKDRNRLDIRGTVSTGKDVCLDVGVVLEGVVKIGNDVSIGPYCVIKNATIESGTVIAAHTVIEDAHVGEDCKVGPFARLRPGASLSGKNNVGNFVEIKASTIGLGSKVNHLSYVGDAELGERVNVGAGTITCNYDGANKFKTVLGDDVFVGSNTSLIAPIEVGAGVTVGAGSTLSKSVDSGALAFTRAKQKTIENWPRPSKNKG